MLETILQMHFSEKLSARDPTASPVIPMMPETSPEAVSSFFTEGFPGTASRKAIFFKTSRVPFRKGLMYLTSISVLRLLLWNQLRARPQPFHGLGLTMQYFSHWNRNLPLS